MSLCKLYCELHTSELNGDVAFLLLVGDAIVGWT